MNLYYSRVAMLGRNYDFFFVFFLLCSFFFFQAEDGIRDRDVTGVQTCALPSSSFAANKH